MSEKAPQYEPTAEELAKAEEMDQERRDTKEKLAQERAQKVFEGTKGVLTWDDFMALGTVLRDLLEGKLVNSTSGGPRKVLGQVPTVSETDYFADYAKQKPDMEERIIALKDLLSRLNGLSHP